MKLCVLLLNLLFLTCSFANEIELNANSLLINHYNLIIDFKYLSSDVLEGRKPQTTGHLLAQKYITQKYTHLALKHFTNSYFDQFEYQKSGETRKGVNLVGYIQGKKYPKLYWVVTAHYDHLGRKGHSIFNGADDNASGVAALLELARYFNQHVPNYSIIFVATDAEEVGLKGAEQFVAAPPVPLTSIMLNINLDMLSQGGRRKTLYVAGTRKNEPFKQAIELVSAKMRTNSFKLKRGHDRIKSRSVGGSTTNIDWKKASDHWAFRKRGIPYLYFGVDTHNDYHTVNDTFERINLLFYQQAVNAVVVSLQNLELLSPQLIRPEN